MNRYDAEQMDADASAGAGAGKLFQTVQPQRDLESNWAVDLAKNLEEYLLKICSGEISGDDDSHLSINFAEAALLLQGSIQVYSRKVEYLYSLVLHALEFISQKSQQEQTPGGESDQPVESGPNAAGSEEDDLFWGLDDIPVDAKNLLDSATCKEATLNHFVRPPANLVVLEGDCLDVTGDAGELESYLLANNDLYRDFIILDSCDAVVVNDFLNGDDKAGNGQNTICRGSSLTSKGHKGLQSPIRRSGSVGHKLSVGRNQNATSNLSPQVNHGFEFNDPNDASFPPAYDSPENNNHEFGMEDGYIDSTDSDDLEDDDPWKPLNPYEPGNLKIKPYKRVKANRRRDVGSKKHILTTEFPLARLHGTISSELNQIWETRRRAVGGENESKSPPLYEKLRQSLIVGGNIDHDAFCNSMDNNEKNGYDSEDPDIGPPDFDMPYMDEELPSHSNENNDGGMHFDNDEAYGDPNARTNLEDLCRSHLDALLASLSETEKQTEMAARVSTWKQRIEQNLEEQDACPAFDIHQYGERILDKLSSGQDSGNSMSFGDVVTGQKKHDVARTFSALLQLVNNGDVDLERGVSGRESTCYTAVNPFYIRFLRHKKKRDHVKLQFSKKRAKSPMMKGHSRGEKNKSEKENQPIFNLSPSKSNSTCRLSLKVGKSGGIRFTPEGKKRRKSRLIEPADLHSGE